MGSGGQSTEAQAGIPSAPEARVAKQTAQAMASTPDSTCRPLGQTEEGWMRAFECGTGHTALGVLLRRHVDRASLQQALDSVLADNPRARTLLVMPPGQGLQENHLPICPLSEAEKQLVQQHKNQPLLLVPEKASVRVRVATGWQPRESMEQLETLSLALEKQSQADSRSDSDAQAAPSITGGGGGSVAGLDSCFEIGRRWEPSPPPESTEASAPVAGECACGCGCGPEGKPSTSGIQLEPRERPAEADGVAQADGVSSEQSSTREPAEGEAGERGCQGSCSCGVRTGRYKLSMCQDKWLQIVEAAMNDSWEDDDGDDEDSSDEDETFCTPSSSPHHSSSLQGQELGWEQEEESALPSQPGVSSEQLSIVQLLKVTLHRLPRSYSLVLLRVHTIACDRVSAALLMEDLLKELKALLSPPISPSAEGTSGVSGVNGSEESEDDRVRRQNLKRVEESIPKKLSRKPIWAHGVDVLGYGLGSRRHAYLPFLNPHEPRRSQLIRSGLSRPDTDLLLKSKALGRKAEHFGVTTLLDLRPMLPDTLHPRTMGFFHSAMLNTHQVGEHTELWDLARRCEESVAHACQKRKQFTDMGDLLMLMGQAMQHPALTPQGSMRTSLLSIFKDTLFERMEPYADSLGIEDYIGCASVHGVGPCLAVFDSIREDGLHMANVYPAPLFSRSQMRSLVIRAMELLHAAIARERSVA